MTTGTRWVRLGLAGALVVASVAALRIGRLGGRASGGEVAAPGCGGAPGSAPEAVPLADEVRLPERAAALGEAARATRQRALATWGSQPRLAHLSDGLRLGTALLLDRIAGRPEFAGVDPDHVQLAGRRRLGSRTEYHLRQLVGWVPVYGASARVVLDADDQVVSTSGTLRPLPAGLSTTPTLEARAAAARAIAAVGCADCTVEASRSWLLIVPREQGPRLAWRIWPRAESGGAPQPMVFVDASSGEVLFSCTREDDPACFDEQG